MQATVDSLSNDAASAARVSLGQAFHTLQDFYSHSNWIELGNLSPHSSLGNGVITNIAAPGENTCIQAPPSDFCFGSNLTTTRLTSGYFGGQDGSNGYRRGKCLHGGNWDITESSITNFGGINKDSSTCFLSAPGTVISISPHADNNPSAESVAIQATKDALMGALNGIKSRVSEEQFKALLGIGPSLAFAIDTTGSMGGEINGVKADVLNIINARKGTAEEAIRYILSPFNDPFVGPLTSTSDPEKFTTALSSLFASGGGDCPELAMEGLYNAVSASEKGGQVFLYTDASAKDSIRSWLVYALAFAKDVKIFNALYGSCSPYDAAYFDTANQTGGQVFLLNRGQTAGVSQLANLLARSSSADILSVAGSLTGGVTTHEFPMDSQTTNITVSVTSTASIGVSIVRPNGSAVSSSDAGVTLIPANSVTTAVIYSIENPSPGPWRVLLTGQGDYSVLVNGESALALDEFRFVRRGGRPGHEGYYPIDGYPVTGVTQNVIAKLSGNPQSVSFELRKRSGEPIQPFNLNSPEADHGELLGEITVPTQPFVVYAVGRDGNGMPFQRMLAKKYTPQPVSVTPPAAVALAKGTSTIYIFQVKNSGPTGQFQFAASDDRRYVTTVTPNIANIPSGQSVYVEVVLKTPSTAQSGTGDTLTFVATNASNPAIGNSAVLVNSVVESNQPDLVITAISASNTVAEPERPLTVPNTLKNQGSVDAGTSTIAFSLSANRMYGDNDDIAISTARSVSFLSDGASSDGVSTTLTMPAAPLGIYYVCAKADSGNTVDEGPFENNNTLCTSSPIELTREDLVMTSVVPNASTVSRGSILSVSDAVKNQGLVSSNTSIVSYRFSANTVYGDADDVVFSASRSITQLSPGGSSIGSSTLTIPSALPPNAYYVCAMVDENNSVIETNETNNTICSVVRVNVQ